MKQQVYYGKKEEVVAHRSSELDCSIADMCFIGIYWIAQISTMTYPDKFQYSFGADVSFLKLKKNKVSVSLWVWALNASDTGVSLCV